VGEVLRRKYKNIKIFAVEPAASPVLSGGQPDLTPSRNRRRFVPSILNTKVYHEIIQVTNGQAAEMAQRLAREEGLLVGISSGAACWAALQVAARLGKGERVITIFPDSGERYLSTGMFEKKSGA
jgi:cysteine synthase A